MSRKCMYAPFFRQQMSAFYPFTDIVCFFLPFFSYDGFPKLQIAERENLKNPNAAKVIWRLQPWERQICHDMRTQKDTRIHPCHIWPKCHCMLKAPTWNFIFLWFFSLFKHLCMRIWEHSWNLPDEATMRMWRKGERRRGIQQRFILSQFQI